MMRINKIGAGIGLTLVLAAMLALPGLALAVGGSAGPGTPAASGEPSGTPATTQSGQQGSTTEPTQDQLRAQLRTRIEERLRIRAQVFDAVATRLRTRIGRVEDLADAVAEAGGNVAAVRTRLQTAQSELTEAVALEKQASRQFRSVPDSPNRRAAFMDARETAARAALKLGQARQSLASAIALLAQTARGLS